MAKPYSTARARLIAGLSTEEKALHRAAQEHFAQVHEVLFGLGQQLRQCRHDKALTQAQLARITGIEQAEISRIESGSSNPTLITLHKLTSVLDLDIAITRR